MTKDIHADVQTSVVTLTLSREHAGNMFDWPMIHEMTQQINPAADHAHCVVTTLNSRDLRLVRWPAICWLWLCLHKQRARPEGVSA